MADFFEFKCVGYDCDGAYDYYKVINIDHISEWHGYRHPQLGPVMEVVVDGSTMFYISKTEHRRFKRFLAYKGHTLTVIDDFPDDNGIIFNTETGY